MGQFPMEVVMYQRQKHCLAEVDGSMYSKMAMLPTRRVCTGQNWMNWWKTAFSNCSKQWGIIDAIGVSLSSC